MTVKFIITFIYYCCPERKNMESYCSSQSIVQSINEWGFSFQSYLHATISKTEMSSKQMNRFRKKWVTRVQYPETEITLHVCHERSDERWTYDLHIGLFIYRVNYLNNWIWHNVWSTFWFVVWVLVFYSRSHQRMQAIGHNICHFTI